MAESEDRRWGDARGLAGAAWPWLFLVVAVVLAVPGWGCAQYRAITDAAAAKDAPASADGDTGASTVAGTGGSGADGATPTLGTGGRAGAAGGSGGLPVADGGGMDSASDGVDAVELFAWKET